MSLSLFNIKNIHSLKSTDFIKIEERVNKSLLHRIDKLLDSIKEALIFEQGFSDIIPDFYDEVFKIRLESIHTLSESNIDLGITKYIESIRSKSNVKKFNTLLSNIQIAIKESTIVTKEVIRQNDLIDFNELDFYIKSDLSYHTYIEILKMSSILPPEVLKDSIKFIESSLILEVVLFASKIVLESYPEKEFSESKIHELEEVVLRSALLYISSAFRIGLVGNKNIRIDVTKNYVSENSTEYNSKLKKVRRKNLDFLTKQAQDLNLGYE